jgi:predicted methyltransferase
MKQIGVFTLLMLMSGLSTGQNPWKDVYSISAWQERDQWQRPSEILALLNLQPGSMVADIGSHEGYFTVKLAESVTNSGRVYAVDISKDKLARLKHNVRDRGLSNVVAIHADKDNPRLEANSVDGVLIVDTYHEFNDYSTILLHIYMALKPQGRLVISEPISDERKGLTRKEQVGKHELESRFVMDDLVRAGFRILMTQEDFVDRTAVKGDRMWVIVAEKPTTP